MILQFYSLKKEYFTKLIFSGIRLKFPIEKGEKVGVVGKNGEGKTTLLKILAGIEDADGGSFRIEPKKTRIFYISADLIDKLYTENNSEAFTFTTDEFLLLINTHLYELKSQIRELEKDLHDPKKFEMYAGLVDKYESRGGYAWEEQASAVLHSLKIADKNIKDLSGGEKSRLILSAIKIAPAELILIDEPTNHLDIIALEELETFIKTDTKSYIIVSHDQKFLDNVVTKIISINNYRAKVYSGNYSSYKQQKESEEQQYLNKYTSTQKEINRLTKLADSVLERKEKGITVVVDRRGMPASKKRMVNTQGKSLKVAKDNDKASVGYFNNRIEAKMRDVEMINRRVGRIEKLKKPKKDWGIKINLEERENLPDIILRTTDLMYSYDETARFVFPDITIYKGEKIAITGPNGIGKSTYAKILMGQLPEYKGTVQITESLQIGYYSQSHSNINFEQNLLQNLFDLDIIEDYDIPVIKDARNFLHQMLFEGDSVFQKASSLSQGEKSKLSIAKIIFQNPSFLILDEPTNHLDIPSKERLEHALKQYTGALLVISHDRYFMESIGISRYIAFG